jgi:hypothetical protein
VSDLLAALTPVAETLDELGVPYHIGGSIASTAFGIVRATNDADLIADLPAEVVSSFVTRLEAEYYVDEAAVRSAVSRRAGFNLIHLSTMLKVDVFVSRQTEFDRQVLARRVDVALSTDPDARRFPLSSPEDVILSKLDWFRRGGGTSERQWGDILGVIRVQSTDLDAAYLTRWAEHLGLTPLLIRAMEEAEEMGILDPPSAESQ